MLAKTLPSKILLLVGIIIYANGFRIPHSFAIEKFTTHHSSSTKLWFKNRPGGRGDFDFDDDEEPLPRGEDFDDYDDFDDEVSNRLKKRFPSPKKRSGGERSKGLFKNFKQFEVLNRAVVAGMFVAGIGTGISIDSAINTNPKDLASRDAIDKNAPNPKLW
jgi:hypothetical protein